MGYVAHNAVVVTGYGTDYTGDYGSERRPAPWIVAVELWRSLLDPRWQSLIVGPIRSVVNDDVSFAFLPDGSKEGWDDSDEGDRLRQELTATVDRFDRYRVDWVDVRFGGDEPDLASIERRPPVAEPG